MFCLSHMPEAHFLKARFIYTSSRFWRHKHTIREIERERQTDRERDREKDRDRQKDRYSGIQREIDRERETNRQTQTNRQRERRREGGVLRMCLCRHDNCMHSQRKITVAWFSKVRYNSSLPWNARDSDKMECRSYNNWSSCLKHRLLNELVTDKLLNSWC